MALLFKGNKDDSQVMGKKTFKKHQQDDPYLAREQEKYEEPVPSREFIMQYLEEVDTPQSFKQIVQAFALSKSQYKGLDRRLRAMERQGQVACNRKGFYGLLKDLELKRGRVQAHRDGYGFLIPDDDSEDVFLSAKQMRGLFTDDVVVARIFDSARQGKFEGVVVELLERHTKSVAGRLYEARGCYFVSPDGKLVNQDISVNVDDLNGANIGDFVVVEVAPSLGQHLTGVITQVLGTHLTPGMEVELALRSHQLPFEWPADLLSELAAFNDSVREEDLEGREDWRHLPFVTIDGEDARDFDDAVYAEPLDEGGWRLIVAIADVAHYVEQGSVLDNEANHRGNSVYFPSRVIPMLPEVLSNGLCSLNPEVDRLAFCCEITLTADAKPLYFQFVNAVIHSHARLTYGDVAAWIDAKWRGIAHPMAQHVKVLHEVYKKLLHLRRWRGAIEFESSEAKIQFSDQGKISCIESVRRNDAHRLIEEMMLLANTCAANYLVDADVACLFRNHETPDEGKLTALRDFLKVFSLRLPGGDQPEAKHYARLIERTEGRRDAHLLQTVLLRSLKQAKYEVKNKGHFGLAYEAYCQFTSPIRRYPDLIVHRTIKQLIQTRRKKTLPYALPELEVIGEHCSMTERRADRATREATDWLKCDYMQDKLGLHYDGVITDVTHFGFFVELKDIYVEGLVHVSNLKNDYYHYDDVHHLLRAKHSGKAYRLGDVVRVQVVRVDIDERQIDFDLSED